MIVYLIGPRACGKSTLAAALAQALDCPFVDTDQELLKAAGPEYAGQSTVAAIVAREGWERFRERESAALRAAQAKALEAMRGNAPALPHAGAARHYIIATGGGMVEREENRDFMRKTGLVLRLNAPVDVLVERMAADEDKAKASAPVRPSLSADSADPRAEMEEILRRREPLYAHAAHHELDAEQAVEALCAEVQAVLKG